MPRPLHPCGRSAAEPRPAQAGGAPGCTERERRKLGDALRAGCRRRGRASASCPCQGALQRPLLAGIATTDRPDMPSVGTACRRCRDHGWSSPAAPLRQHGCRGSRDPGPRCVRIAVCAPFRSGSSGWLLPRNGSRRTGPIALGPEGRSTGRHGGDRGCSRPWPEPRLIRLLWCPPPVGKLQDQGVGVAWRLAARSGCLSRLEHGTLLVLRDARGQPGREVRDRAR